MKIHVGLICFIYFALFHSSLILAQSVDQSELLGAVEQMRATTISQVASGYGVAEEQGDNFQLAMNGTHDLTPLHRVEFVFSGNDCLWLEYAPNHPEKLISSTLIKGGIQINYFVVPPPRRSGVIIEAANQRASFLDPLPRTWTYNYLTRMPSDGWDEKKFFTLWMHKPYAKIIRQDGIITININTPVYNSNDKNNVMMNFDTSCGGLLTYYKSDLIYEFENNVQLETDTLTLAWLKSGNIFIPVFRNVDSHFEQNGKDAGYWQTHVKFTQFVVGPISPNQLSITAMQIPVGTMILDHIHQDRYFYSIAEQARMLEGITAVTQPSGASE
jgi:hypothetical protein